MSKRSEIRERWRRILEGRRSSGLSVTAYCRRMGVQSSGYYKWRHKLGEHSGFAEVKVKPLQSGAAVSEPGGIELRISGERTIVVRPGFDRQTLLALLAVLETGSHHRAEWEAGT